MKIEVGQYWLVEDGVIAYVTGRSEDDSMWLVNRVTSSGHMLNNVGVADCNFKMVLTAREAMRRSEEYLRGRLKTMFNLERSGL